MIDSESVNNPKRSDESLKCDDETMKINPFSRLFFCWMVPLFWRGRNRELTSEDLGKAVNSHLSQSLGDRLEQQWQKEIVRANKLGKEPRLIRALFWSFIWGYLLDGFLLFFQGMVCKPFQPVLLALLIHQFSSGSDFSLQRANIYAGGLILLSFLAVIIQHHVFLRTQQRGMRIRIACCSLLYRKTLRLSSAALGQTTAGQLVNLMSNDVNRFDTVLMFLHFLWIMPFQILLMCYLIYLQVDMAAVVGVISVTLQTIPVQSYLSRWSSKLRMKIAHRTDERVCLMNEIISGIQVIKMYAWEKPFEYVVSAARDKELKAIRGASYIRGIYMGFMVFTERASLYITLLASCLMGCSISASAVFSLAQFYNKIQESLAFHYPNAMSMGAECLVTIQRIQDFLMLEECTDIILKKKNSMRNGIENHDLSDSYIKKNEENMQIIKPIDINKNKCVKLKHVSASWSKMQDTLNDISMDIDKGKLCVIVGSVGAGKSSILQLLLKELPLHTGTMNIGGEISYASQEPWLFVDTIRNNILFGQEYDHAKYKKVVKVCALEDDFKQFPCSDLSLVGERGISLSGGQKARINLARAVYKEADIYLLDDPLSAVDAHVGRHLFEQCITGYLGDKTRILITHQTHYLKAADLIIILQKGQIEYSGTYSDLLLLGKDSSDLLDLLQQNKEESENEDGYHYHRIRRDTVPSLHLVKKPTILGEFEENLKAENEIKEDIGNGKIKFDIYWQYWTAGGNKLLVYFMAFAMIFGQLTATAADYWVTFWSNQQSENIVQQERHEVLLNYTSNDIFSLSESILSLDNFNDSLECSNEFDMWKKVGQFNTAQYLMIYTGLILACVFFITSRSFLFFIACMKSSKGLHNQMFHKLLRVKMKFFDENPSGRILNRFSKDVGAMDELLPRAMIEMIQIFLVFCSIMLLITITNPWLLLPVMIVLFIFYYLLNFYLVTAQTIKRLETITRSPVFSHLSASLNGITTIRAFKSQNKLINEFDHRQDIHTAAWNNYLACGGTLGFWLDIICIIFLTVVCYSFIYINGDSALSGNVGLAISQTLILMGMLQFGVRQTSEVAAQMTSVERIIHYTKLEKETSDDDETVVGVPDNWPSKGTISFKNVSLKYKVSDPPVLKNLNFCVKNGWKVGVVGRTGAGKSSLIAALFRLADIEGQIEIDSCDTKNIVLQDIRTNISIIPQEPVLFSASLRYNLDPFGAYDDAALWAAMGAVELIDGVLTLDYKISNGGANLSLGQRQLICLARAILRNNKILVLDEATANVDPQTDIFIQKTIREKFSHCTVLTIAHRLNTIMDSDRVLVMNKGCVVEFDHPHILLQNTDGYLYKMVQETGNNMQTKLIEIANKTYINKTETENS